MIDLLIAVSLAAQPGRAAHRISARPAAPCQAVPTLCLAAENEGEGPRLTGGSDTASDNTMNAYRFDARPCRIIGNMCPKRANRQLFRLGEPIAQTLTRSFGLD